jgi:hypothetical protein
MWLPELAREGISRSYRVGVWSGQVVHNRVIPESSALSLPESSALSLSLKVPRVPHFVTCILAVFKKVVAGPLRHLIDARCSSTTSLLVKHLINYFPLFFNNHVVICNVSIIYLSFYAYLPKIQTPKSA